MIALDPDQMTVVPTASSVTGRTLWSILQGDFDVTRQVFEAVYGLDAQPGSASMYAHDEKRAHDLIEELRALLGKAPPTDYTDAYRELFFVAGSMLERDVLGLIIVSGSEGITLPKLCDAIYSDDNAELVKRRSILTTLSHLRKRMETSGWRIPLHPGGRGNRPAYRLERA